MPYLYHIYTKPAITIPGIGHTPRAISSSFGEYSTQVTQVSHSVTILVHQVPIITSYAEAVWNEEFVQCFYTWPAVGIEAQTIDLEFNTLYPLSCELPLL